MPTRIDASRQPQTRSTKPDLGPALINAVNSIGPGTDNTTINRLASNIASRVGGDTRWVGEMLYQMRGAHQGVSGDKARFLANVDKASRLGVLGPNGRATLRAKVGAAADAQDNRSRVETSILDVKNQPQRRDVFETPALLKGTSSEYKPNDVFTPGAGQKQRAPTVQQKKADVPTPKLDNAISGLDQAIKRMPDGVIKSSLSTVKSSLELARTAQKNGDTVAYTKAIGGLSQNVFKTVGEVVKRFGQDGELASQAAEQLGKVASFIGKGVKVVSAVEDLSKVLRGKTLSGNAVTGAQRADAAINLVTTVLGGTVGTAATIAKAKLEWCFNHIGVPAKQALTEYGLKRLFGGKTVEQMREQIRSLPTSDPTKAKWALSKLVYETFPNTTSGFSQATASSLWKRAFNAEMASYESDLRFLKEHENVKPGSNPMVDEMRVKIAGVAQRAALRFLDGQVADAKGSWGV